MEPIVLDTIKGISFNPDIPPIKNCHGLIYIPVGLHTLASTVRVEEIRLYPDENLSFRVSFASNTSENIIACCFHWFAISLVNYIRLVGLIDVMIEKGWRIESLQNPDKRKTVKEHCVEYVKEVIPNVHAWRNKIAAHFAITDPWNDNLGTLQDSIMHPVSYIRPYYCVGAHQYSLGEEESSIPRWSLTQTFEALSQRYWPEVQLRPLESDNSNR